MASLYNLARVYSSTIGTGSPMSLGTNVTGFLTFAAAGVPDGAVVTYVVSNGAATEIGRGTYHTAGPTLSRDTILKSTNSGSPISLTGTEIVFITAAAEDIPTPGTATIDFGAAPGTNIASVTVTGQPNIKATGSSIRAWIQGNDSTADHNAAEHALFSRYVGVSATAVSAGVGFVITAVSEFRLSGTMAIRWSWTN